MTQLTTFTNAEFEALYELHHVDYVVYIWLRKYMDYGTGIVGVSRGISRQMLLERTYVPETRGRGRQSMTVSALRESIGRLIGRGLLGHYGNGQRLIFRMPMAYTGKFRPQEQQPRNSRPDNTEQQPTSGINVSSKPSSSSGNHTDARVEMAGDDDSTSEIPERPVLPGQWLLVFNRRYGHSFDPASMPVRRRWWPTWTGWVEAAVTQTMVDEMVRQARDNAREPIVDMVAYVDRMLASKGSARGQGGGRNGQRRAVVVALTGGKGGDQDAIDTTATRLD